MRELKRAKEITVNIVDDKATWRDLFKRHTFFSDGYKYYLSIVAASKTRDAQLIWSGLVESKVRRLVGGIENNENSVELAHPFNKGFERIHTCKNDEEIDEVCQGSLKYQAKDTKTETTDVTHDPAHNAVADGNSDEATVAPKSVDKPQDKPDDHDTKMTGDEANGERETTIYTTTYYVGLELSKGTCDPYISVNHSDAARFEIPRHLVASQRLQEVLSRLDVL